MNLRTMIAALAAATVGVALLAAPGHAQTDPNASAATAPKASNDTAPPASAAKRKPATSAAPSTQMMSATTAGEAASAAKVQPGKGAASAR
jgi:hypothetical protein